MKRVTLILIAAMMFINNIGAAAWGKIGHATIGYVAECHLTPEAKVALDKYLDGLPLSAIASDADAYRGKWTVDLGFVPTNPEAARVSFVKDFDFSTPLNVSPFSHSISVDEKFKCFPTDNLDGAYINNAAYYVDNLAAKLKKDASKMEPYEVYKSIALIVHLVGDMHCPMHIVYIPANTSKGHVNVKFKKKEYSLHSIWDRQIFEAYYNWSFMDMAHLVDTATEKQIEEITKGDVYDYAGRSAENSWPAIGVYADGDVLPKTYPTDMRPILFSQLRDGGYRLAAILNDIFE